MGFKICVHLNALMLFYQLSNLGINLNTHAMKRSYCDHNHRYKGEFALKPNLHTCRHK